MPRAFLIKNKKQSVSDMALGQEQGQGNNTQEATVEEGTAGEENHTLDVEEEEDSRTTPPTPPPHDETRNMDKPHRKSDIFMVSNLRISHEMEMRRQHRPPPLLELQRLPYRFSPMILSMNREPRQGDTVAGAHGVDLQERGGSGVRGSAVVAPVRRMSSPPVDPINIYPSPSPSSEEHVTCDDASTSSDDEPRDVTRLTSGHDVTPTTMPKPRLSFQPEIRWHNHVTSFPRHPGLPSPGTSPEPDQGDKGLSPKRRRSDESVSSTSLSISPPRHDMMHPGDISPDIPRHKSGEGFWPSGLPGMSMSLSMSAHHPYLALSFQRLQQLHLRAAQEGINKYPHLSPPPPPLTSLATLPLPHLPPFTPLPPGPGGLPPPPPSPAGSPGLSRRAMSPSHPRPDDYCSMPSSRVERIGEYPLQSYTPATPTTVSHVTPPRIPSSSPQEAIAPKTFPRDDTLPLDLDTKSAAEKRKRREGEPPRYNCEACGKSYSTFSGLSKHKQFHCTSHVQKQFNCKYCDKTYVSLGALKMHIRTHTLPCKCHLCGKAFSRPWLLQGHVRTHTGEKPFQCSHCGRSFADRSNLRAHLQTHSDVKKYSCRSCSKTFSRMSLLLKHEDGGCAGLAHS